MQQSREMEELKATGKKDPSQMQAASQPPAKVA